MAQRFSEGGGRVRVQRQAQGLALEYSALGRGRLQFGLTFGANDDGRDLLVTLGLPWLMTLYVTLVGVFPRRWFLWDVERGQDREISVGWHDDRLRYCIWVGSMASWSRRAPWCRWWRQGSLVPLDLIFGRERCKTVLLAENIATRVPMPEAVYPAVAKVEAYTWTRPRWPFWPLSRTRVSAWLDIPKGIPHAGKGENSWDCGDDGLFGIGGDSVDAAIANAQSSVTRDRKRYGSASPKAMRDALRA